MRAKTFTIIAFMLLSIVSFSQNQPFSSVDFYSGPLFKGDGDYNYTGVFPLGIVNDKVYMVAPHITENYPGNAVGKRRERVIIVSDEKFETTKTVSTEKLLEGKKLVFVHAIVSNNRVFTFYSYYNKDLDKEFLFMDEFDTEKDEFKNEIKKIIETDCGKQQMSKNIVYDFAFSPNHSNFAIVNEVCKNGSSDIVDFGFYLFDANMVLKNEKKSVLGEGKWSSLSDLMVDDNGHIYALSYKAEKETDAKEGIYSLIDYNSKTNSTNDIILKGEKKINFLTIAINKNNKVVAIGFVTEKDMTQPTGIISFSYLQEKQQFNQVDLKPFTKEFVLAATDQKGLSKFEMSKDYNEYGIYPYSILVKDDNGFVFHAEEAVNNGATTSVISSGGITTSTPVGPSTYNNQDIYVFDVDANANINYITVVKKIQTYNFVIVNLSSYSILNNNGKTYVLFNDQESISKSLMKAPLALVEITPDGLQTKKLLSSKEDQGVCFSVPLDIINNKFYLYGSYLTKHCFALVTIGDE